jgi:uncharacterized membrane protein YjgN (DUF898 family)
MGIEGGYAESSSEEDAEEERPRAQLSFRFTGTANEYFRIWIVNLCLTLFTLGVFSAWAKVRKKRYFYSHTRLAGTPFQYLGAPIPILKGRVIAAAFAVAWYVVVNFVPQLLWVVALAALVLTPWVIARSVAFNARYSAYRNLTFAFRGGYGGVMRRLLGCLVVTLLTCGIAYPWLRRELTEYVVSHTEFGANRARYRASAWDFFRPYLVVAGMIGAPLGILAVALAGNRQPNLVGMQVFSVLSYLLYFVGFTYLRAKITNVVWNGTALGPVRFTCSLSARRLLGLYLTNTLAIFASAGLLLPWATVRTLRYRASRFGVELAGDLREFAGSDRTAVRAAGAEVGAFFDLDVAL